jgi:hypothetical protein
VTTQGKPRKAAVAAWIGSALEYYDFFIYGTAAALVFGKVFFPSSEPATGTLLALATFGDATARRSPSGRRPRRACLRIAHYPATRGADVAGTPRPGALRASLRAALTYVRSFAG